MRIEYRTAKTFHSKELEALFLSVNWLSGKYPKRLEKAINHSDTVFSAWDGNRLIGLINAIDDSEMTAYVHYLLIHPDYQSHGIGKELVLQMKEHYKDYLYLLIMAEEKDKVPFYKKLGFEVAETSTPLMVFHEG